MPILFFISKVSRKDLCDFNESKTGSSAFGQRAQVFLHSPVPNRIVMPNKH